MSDNSQFIIAIDHNERNRYHFQHKHRDIPVSIAVLPAGKYSLVGYEHEIAIERKTAADLFVACSIERDLFLEDLDKLDRITSPHLIIECTIDDILNNPPPGTVMSRKSVIASVVAWSNRYGITPWFCDNRQIAEQMTYTILHRWYSDHVLGDASDSTYRRARRQAAAYTMPLREAAKQAEHAARAFMPTIGTPGST